MPRLALLLTVTLTVAACSDGARDPTSPTAEPVGEPMAFAVASNTWVTRAPAPTDIWGPTSASITNPTTLRTTVYIVGGRSNLTGVNNPTSAVRAYDVSGNTWRKLAPYPRGVRATNGAQVIRGKIYVSGGVSRRWDAVAGKWRIEILKTLYVYTPGTNAWTRKRDMPFPQADGVSGVYRDQLFVAAHPDQGTGVVLGYNPATDRWRTVTSTPFDWVNPATAGGFIGGKFYLVAASGAVHVYDPAAQQWTTGATRPVRLCYPGYTTMAAKLWLTGCAEDDDHSGMYPMLVYDPKVNTWTRRAATPTNPNEYSDDRTLSRVTVLSGGVATARLELVGGARPGNNLQYVP
jgi:hypothetical protein